MFYILRQGCERGCGREYVLVYCRWIQHTAEAYCTETEDLIYKIQKMFHGYWVQLQVLYMLKNIKVFVWKCLVCRIVQQKEKEIERGSFKKCKQ